MAKQIIRGQAARKKLFQGVEELALTVTTTLGPRGRNIALDRRWSAPTIIHDGVSIAREIDLKDPFENMGAQLVKEASMKTADHAGDGTTTSTLLAYELTKGGLDALSNGINPMSMKKGIERAVEKVVKRLEELAQPIETKEQIKQIATISAADSTIGEMISNAMERVTKNGVISVEDGTGFTTEIEYKEGVEFDKGYYSHFFVTNTDKMIVEVENPRILFTDMKIDSPQELVEWLGTIVTPEERTIVLIADSFDNNTLPTLVANKQRGNLNVAVIEAPGFGIKRRWELEDMAIMTGGAFISKEASRTLQSVKPEELGRADKIWCDIERTRIIGGKGDKNAMKTRAEGLEEQKTQLTSDFEKKQLDERIAKLTGGVAIIKAGAQTEVEMREKKERIIDAVEATKSAIAEGIVAGGGIALLQAREYVDDEQYTKEEEQGARLVYRTLEKPFRKLLENAGFDGLAILDITKNRGYDMETGKEVNMFEAGIIDPKKVTRQALQNAASVAAMILTTEGLVTDYEEDKKSPLETL